jgi:hypothetical protein
MLDMPSERRHSRHSGAYLPLQPPPDLDTLDSEMPQASRQGMCKVIALTNRCSFLSEAGRVTVWGQTILNGANVSQQANTLSRIAVDEVQTKQYK